MIAETGAWLSGALGRLDFSGVEAWAGLEASAAVKDLEEVVAFAEVVRELHHLEAQAARAQALGG